MNTSTDRYDLFVICVRLEAPSFKLKFVLVEDIVLVPAKAYKDVRLADFSITAVEVMGGSP